MGMPIGPLHVDGVTQGLLVIHKEGSRVSLKKKGGLKGGERD